MKWDNELQTLMEMLIKHQRMVGNWQRTRQRLAWNGLRTQIPATVEDYRERCIIRTCLCVRLLDEGERTQIWYLAVASASSLEQAFALWQKHNVGTLSGSVGTQIAYRGRLWHEQLSTASVHRSKCEQMQQGCSPAPRRYSSARWSLKCL